MSMRREDGWVSCPRFNWIPNYSYCDGCYYHKDGECDYIKMYNPLTWRDKYG